MQGILINTDLLNDETGLIIYCYYSVIIERLATKAGRYLNRWFFVAAVLVVIIIAGSIVIWLGFRHHQSIEIALTTASAPEGKIYVGGGVNNPGIYPFYADDSFEDILQAAGGLADGADLGHIELKITAEGEVVEFQKVNINTADIWLLAALPGIGDTRAQAIAAYRQQYGAFRDINELLNVEGIGTVTLENIRDMITVND